MSEKSKKNQTIQYYDQNAADFVENTRNVDFHVMQDEFIEGLPAGAKILDLGCGSGRDTKYFLEHGYRVDAIDGSAELCALASEYTGIPVKCQLFQELDASEVYDGIWACSSILHLEKTELRSVLKKMADALRPDGWIYTSFKYGEYEGERNGRYLTDFTIDTFADFVQEIHNLQIKEHWITGDVRSGRGEEKWLNLIMQKK